MTSPIIPFFEGTGIDHAGRRLQDILAWPDSRLESVHDYIQWVFPNRKASPYNPHAPLLTPAVISDFRDRPALRDRLAEATDRMEQFYKLSDEKPWWVVPADHNHLRITRILLALNALGLEARAQSFHGKLMAAVWRGKGIIPLRTLAIWLEAME